MHLRKWPYWLRGGVIGGGIALVSGLMGCGEPTLLCYIFSAPSLPLFPLYPFFIAVMAAHPALATFFMLATVVILWFLLGSILGLLIGLVKNKKSPRV